MKKRHSISLVLICICVLLGSKGCSGCGCDVLSELINSIEEQYSVEDFTLATTADKVVYVANSDLDDYDDLYVTDIDRDTSICLTSDFDDDEDSRDLADTALASDSSFVVFQVSETSSLHDLYSVDLLGETIHALATNVYEDKFLISPDDQKVVFISDYEVSGVNRLYVVPIEGGTVTRLSSALSTNTELDVTNFKISADSSTVVFSGDLETHEYFEIYSVSISGGTITKISQNGDTTYDLQSAFTLMDNDWVVFSAKAEGSSDTDLHATPITAASAVDLTPDEFPLLAGEGIYHTTTGVAAYVAGTDTNDETLVGVTADDQNYWEVASSLSDLTTYEFSDDGSKIFYVENSTTLSVIDATGGTATALTSSLTSADTDFQMTGDNQYIIYGSTGGSYINRIDVSTGIIATLVSTDTLFGIDDFKLSEDGVYIVLKGNPVDEDDHAFYSIPVVGGSLVKISD